MEVNDPVAEGSSPPAAAEEGGGFQTLASIEFGSDMLWSGFRGALNKVDPEQVRAALMKQDSLASILSAADAPKVDEFVEQLGKKIHDRQELGEEETASVEAIETVASEAAQAAESSGATGVAVRAMWGVLRSELMATSEQVDREIAELDKELGRCGCN